MEQGILILFVFPLIYVLLEIVNYIFTGERLEYKVLTLLMEWIILLIYPFLYFGLLDEETNDCCTASATFSPDHKLSIIVLILLCVAAFFYSKIKTQIASPLLELLCNTFLLIGIVFNVFMIFQIKIAEWVWILGNLPIILIFILQLADNQKKFINYNQHFDAENAKHWEKWAWKILNLKPIAKFPLLFLLCLPVMVVLATLLLIFGQKPDSFIRAFTDTYKHGFSQLDHLCENVNCGGHFLCSVAAQGHQNWVKPQRLGERGGKTIICNRQLLVANAFEELIEQKLPKMHKIIRHHYNKVGNVIHQYYGIFENKWVADAVYVLMKPLEWIFLLTLYTFDKNPENRIAVQYLSPKDRKAIQLSYK
jgi:hypothetical protein